MDYQLFASGKSDPAKAADMYSLVRNEITVLKSYRAMYFVAHASLYSIAIFLKPINEYYPLLFVVTAIDMCWIAMGYHLCRKRAQMLSFAQFLTILVEEGLIVRAPFTLIKQFQQGMHRQYQNDPKFVLLFKHSDRRLIDKFLFLLMLFTMGLFWVVITDGYELIIDIVEE